MLSRAFTNITGTLYLLDSPAARAILSGVARCCADLRQAWSKVSAAQKWPRASQFSSAVLEQLRGWLALR